MLSHLSTKDNTKTPTDSGNGDRYIQDGADDGQSLISLVHKLHTCACISVFTKSKVYIELLSLQKYISLSAPQGRIHTVLLVQCQPLSSNIQQRYIFTDIIHLHIRYIKPDTGRPIMH